MMLPVVSRIAPRRGALLIEVLLALTLGLAVIGAFSGVLASSLRWSRVLVARAEALEVVRTVWVVLDEELRPGIPGRDWTRAGPSSVELRAFRGVARICASTVDDGGWTVAYRGRRLPDPVRDSILVLGADGGWRAFDLERVGSEGDCAEAAGEFVQRWVWQQGAAPAPVLARLFERGEYHLADGAFRYRRGSGGRQPLTPERIGTESGFRLLEGGLQVTVTLIEEDGVRTLQPFTWPVFGSDPDVR